MSDPLRSLTNWHGMGFRPSPASPTSGQLIRRDHLQYAAHLIRQQELRVWFEPNWRDARTLARRFPFCAVCAIPDESSWPGLRHAPGWRPRRNNGVV